jgi:glycyl-tRNA synthetase beta chain
MKDVPDTRYFLLEIGCEELPDWMLSPALDHLEKEFLALVKTHRLGSPILEPRRLATPRRLALRSRGLLEHQEDREVEVLGPRVQAAYDEKGRPTKALEGFARSQGVEVEKLVRLATPKGECLGLRRREKGLSAAEVLSKEMPRLIASIPFGKTMRWGSGPFRFARPIQWMICLLGNEQVPFEVAGISSGRESRGPRFMGSPKIPMRDARDYVSALEEGGVICDPTERKRRIEEGILRECQRLGRGHSVQPRARLLETLIGLVEHPVVVAGSFDPSFLALPGAVLATAMIHHQRFIPVISPHGGLSEHFLAVLNCDGRKETVERIRRGNEWVLRARLRDADFFWKEDLKHMLRERVPELEKVLFEASLGSYRKKVERVSQLSRYLAGELAERGCGLDAPALVEAAEISKSDLTTLMVKEFPELQGIMAGLYARHEGRPEPVCRALEQQYLGSGESEERTPFSTREGAVLAAADRIDTLAGFFLLGRVPTGSRDPFGLRRAALALVHGALDLELRFSISRLKERAVVLYREQGVQEGEGEGIDRLEPFIQERLRHVCQEVLGLRYDAVNAALAVGSDDLLDAARRARALDGIRGQEDLEALSLSYRRVRNILSEHQVEPLSVSTLPLEEERALLGALESVEEKVGPLLEKGEYAKALAVLAHLRSPLDRFFEKVLVMDEDPGIRRNRLGLLKRISLLLLRVGDFAEMVLEGEKAPLPAVGGKRG